MLERLPTTNAREQYLEERREERGRPALNHRLRFRLRGNIKDAHEDKVADWINEDDIASYHALTIPYGEKFHAKKIEKLCYTRELCKICTQPLFMVGLATTTHWRHPRSELARNTVLKADWNTPEERKVYLHQHPAFLGRVGNVIADCCVTCPKPMTPENVDVAKKEGEIYVSGEVSFRIDDPGRQVSDRMYDPSLIIRLTQPQQIGFFNPLTEND